MLADTAGTVAAGFVGCLNGAWDIQHRTFATALEQGLGDADTDTPLTSVVFEVVRDLHDMGYGHYARGAVIYGGNLLVRQDSNPTAVEIGVNAVPLGVRIRPNPAGHQVFLEYNGSVLPGEISISVFDASGRLVREMTHESSAGPAVWDGNDGRGNPVPSGTYLIRAKVMDESVSGKVIVLE